MPNEFTRISRSQLEFQRNQNNFNVAEDINRTDIVKLGDLQFFDKVMFDFENNRYTNAIFLNELKDKEFSDFGSSHNMIFNNIESCIQLQNPSEQGVYFSTRIRTNEQEIATLNDFFLVVDEDLPAGTDILYYLVTNLNEVFPIRPNNTEPMTIKAKESKPTSFKIKAVFKSNGQDIPKLKGLAVLYYDAFVDMQLGLIHPDLRKNNGKDTIEDDEITLIRDPLQEDKLVEIASKWEAVKLEYSEDGEDLVNIKTFNNITGEIQEKVTLIYDDYLNSEGITERVLHKVRTKVDFSEEED